MSGNYEGSLRKGGGKNLLKDEIVIYTGSFGSGKTEISINHSIKAIENGGNVVIVDLDIVNPYFRSREMRDNLKDLGINVIAPPGKYAMADIPLISPEIKGIIQDINRLLIIDVGGDDVGAKSLATFYPVLKESGYEMNMVVNPFRPFTNNVSQIQAMLQEIEVASRLKVNGLISNPNLGSETDLELIKKGHKIVKQVSEKVKLPIKYLVVEKSFYKNIRKNKVNDLINNNENIFPIHRYMQLPWDKGS